MIDTVGTLCLVILSLCAIAAVVSFLMSELAPQIWASKEISIAREITHVLAFLSGFNLVLSPILS